MSALSGGAWQAVEEIFDGRDARATSAPLRPFGWLAITAMIISGIATVVVGGFATLLTIGTYVTAETDGFVWGPVVVSWLLTALFVLPIVLIRRHRRGAGRSGR